EPNKLVQSRIGVGSSGDPIEQNRAQSLEHLASSRGDMIASCTSFELSEGFLCLFCILEEFNSDFGGLRGAFRDNALKYGTQRCHSVVQCRCEIAGRREAKALCELGQWVRLVRNGVGLLFRFDLQAVFNAAEKSIRIIQRQHFIVREQIQFSQCAERLEHARFLYKRITRAMDKLQRLYDELDVANAAAPEFYIALQLFRPNHVALDAVFNACNFLEQIWRCTLWVDERLM